MMRDRISAALHEVRHTCYLLWRLVTQTGYALVRTPVLQGRRHTLSPQQRAIARAATIPELPAVAVPPPPPVAQPAHTLHRHAPRPHVVRNPNAVHAAERTDFNSRIAVWLTSHVGTMLTAYTFAVLAFVGLFGVLSILPTSTYILIAWLSQTFIQLVLLPVIMVGQNVLNRHAELQADEMFKSVQNTEHEEEQEIAHLSAQDGELLKHTETLEAILTRLSTLSAPPVPTDTRLVETSAGSTVPLVPFVPAPKPPAPALSSPRSNKSRPAKVSRRF
jgi:uncharacterized membrane protein